MARFYPSNSVSSTGVSSDDVTITSLDVPESKTALTSDSDNEVIQGKLKEVSAATETVGSVDTENSRVQLAIPTRGLYSLTAKLFTSFSDMANLIGLIPSKIAQGESILGVNGAFKGLGDATQADVRSGKTFSTAELSEVPGTMAEHAGGTFKPSTSDKTVIAKDRYLTGDVIVKGDPNLIAANIKKNVTIFGIKGTADGWVVEDTDLYNNGSNLCNFRIAPDARDVACSFASDCIAIKRQFSHTVLLYTMGPVFIGKYTKINFDFTVTEQASTSEFLNFVVRASATSAYNNDDTFNPTQEIINLGNVDSAAPTNTRKVATLKLASYDHVLRESGHLQITIHHGGNTKYTSAAKIHRIWLSMD